MAPQLAAHQRAWGWFTAWASVGATWALALIGIASTGLFVLPLAAGATVVVALRAPSTAGLPGLGLPPPYVSYLNRSGPGNVCTSSHGRQSCIQALDPWPWLRARQLSQSPPALPSSSYTAENAISRLNPPRHSWAIWRRPPTRARERDRAKY